jgi:hypothetical protein
MRKANVFDIKEKKRKKETWNEEKGTFGLTLLMSQSRKKQTWCYKINEDEKNTERNKNEEKIDNKKIKRTTKTNESYIQII